MSTLARAAGGSPVPARRPQAIPWHVWAALAASTAILIAGQWDLSWHRSVGRDTFFSPPHCLLYAGALLACGSSGFVILRTTFSARAPEDCVKIWGFRGPFGAFVAAWGGIAMLASGPFDDWWHGAYGLDIVIHSPPHTLLISGTLSIVFGALLLATAQLNRAEREPRKAAALVIYAGSVLLLLLGGALMEDTFNHLQHTTRFYVTVALVVPGLLASVAVASRHAWGATLVAAVYTLGTLAMIAIFPLFSAEAKLGPVLQPITHFVPPAFPMLLVLGAAAFDRARRALEARPLLVRAAAGGGAFFVAFSAAQWPFASFLMSRWANHPLFATNEFAYFLSDTSLAVRKQFYVQHASQVELWLGLGLALALAILSTSLGLGAGAWLRNLQR